MIRIFRFLEGSFDVDIVERQYDTDDSDISLAEDISIGTDHDENDMFHVKFNGMKRRAFRKNTVI